MTDNEHPVGRTVADGSQTEVDSVTVDAPSVVGDLVAGTELGGRYRIWSKLGAGGMGEVWHAFDLKLRVEVALKALRQDLRVGSDRLELLRREVRAARQVVSPNVCRIFDLEEMDGRELVSMEYVDGQTLLAVLKERGPLELKEAKEIASQFLAGLEAIHGTGLVHRDIKPENIMLTRTGRVVVMDFGLARDEADPTRSRSGTPAYMAPEQARGDEVDARADVYSAGVVLAEMVSPGGVKDLESRKSLWEGVRSDPPKLPDTPWAPVIRKAVAKRAEERYESASALTRALEKVTQRVVGAEDVTPYPGLASFTEAEAEYFFGREAEVERMWRKLEGTPRLLGLVGPSGAGKTSFLRAGLIPTAGPDWGIVRCTPGDAAVSSLRRALIPELAGDSEALQQLVDPDDDQSLAWAVSRWRKRHDNGLLIVDQFEELLTQNTTEEQTRFAAFLARIALSADVHVLLSLRDDFLAQCNAHEPLRPIFHELTVLDPPTGPNLRRALVQPAVTCGYRFEDDELVDEMLAEVAGERGALPLLAFAMARLWEKRDRENGQLTRQAYEDIGGVGGALAQHAEATIDRVGTGRVPIVREIFRNLVTAEGTRAVREWRDLLSIFGGESRPRSPGDKPLGYGEGGGRRLPGGKPPARETSTTSVGQGLPPLQSSTSVGHGLPPLQSSTSVGQGLTPWQSEAEEVLRELIDARLLTSYEIQEEDEEPTRRVEIIHESLLANWPRLVRWQTQDVDAAQLRDQLRQAARTWEEHERSDDLLWTGSAYREFSLWRERYPGGLSDTESAFGDAMTSHAHRRRRRRRVAALAVIIGFAIVAVVFAGLWRRSELEASRAEAAKLVALAQAQLQTDPTEALAYVTASLGLIDSPAARSFVVRALWEAPPAMVLESPGQEMGFSPEGGRIALSGYADVVTVWSDSGEGPIVFPGLERTSESKNSVRWISEDLLAAGFDPLDPVLAAERVRIGSIPKGEFLQTIEFGAGSFWQVEGHRLFAITLPSEPAHEGKLLLRSWRLPDGEPEDLGRIDWQGLGASDGRFEPSGNAWIYSKGRTIYSRPLPLHEGGRDRVVGTHTADPISFLDVSSNSDRLVSLDIEGELRVWSFSAPGGEPLQVIQRPESVQEPYYLFPDSTGRWVFRGFASQIGKGLLWDLSALPGAQPLELRRSGSWQFSGFDFHPKGDWLAASTTGSSEVSFWPLRGAYPSLVKGATSTRKGLAFSPDGRWLAATWAGWRVKLFPLPHTDNTGDPKLGEHPAFSNLSFGPSGTRVTGGHWGSSLSVGFLDGHEPRRLEGFLTETLIESLAFSPSGRLVAAASGISYDEKMLRVWDLDTGETRAFELPRTDAIVPSGDNGYVDNVQSLWFTDEDTLYTVGATAFLRWNLKDGSSEEVVALDAMAYREAAASADGRKVLIIEDPNVGRSDICDTPELYDLAAGTAEELPSFSDCARVIALDPGGDVAVTGDAEGTIRVGRVAGGEPHLLLGHQGAIEYVAISPDLRWVASVGADSTLRLWPMPDLSKPPLHTMPREELIAKLKTLTNLRVVRDEESSTGWKPEIGPFPGWKYVPTW